MADWWTADDGGITVQVRAVPGAKRSEVVGVADGRLRVRVQAPAVEGKANVALIRVLAGWAGVRRSAVTIERGEHARTKSVRIAGLDRPPST